VTSQAQDSQGNIYPLTVEYIGKVPEFDWITEDRQITCWFDWPIRSLSQR
jgi:hypothetical protein